MTLKRDDQPFPKEPVDVGIGSEQERGTSAVLTRVGRNTVDIDVPALRHLVDTVKDMLKP
jgi:hypothetical protein